MPAAYAGSLVTEVGWSYGFILQRLHSQCSFTQISIFLVSFCAFYSYAQWSAFTARCLSPSCRTACLFATACSRATTQQVLHGFHSSAVAYYLRCYGLLGLTPRQALSDASLQGVAYMTRDLGRLVHRDGGVATSVACPVTIVGGLPENARVAPCRPGLVVWSCGTGSTSLLT